MSDYDATKPCSYPEDHWYIVEADYQYFPAGYRPCKDANTGRVLSSCDAACTCRQTQRQKSVGGTWLDFVVCLAVTDNFTCDQEFMVDCDASGGGGGGGGSPTNNTPATGADATLSPDGDTNGSGGGTSTGSSGSSSGLDTPVIVAIAVGAVLVVASVLFIVRTMRKTKRREAARNYHNEYDVPSEPQQSSMAQWNNEPTPSTYGGGPSMSVGAPPFGKPSSRTGSSSATTSTAASSSAQFRAPPPVQQAPRVDPDAVPASFKNRAPSKPIGATLMGSAAMGPSYSYASHYQDPMLDTSQSVGPVMPLARNSPSAKSSGSGGSGSGRSGSRAASSAQTMNSANPNVHSYPYEMDMLESTRRGPSEMDMATNDSRAAPPSEGEDYFDETSTFGLDTTQLMAVQPDGGRAFSPVSNRSSMFSDSLSEFESTRRGGDVSGGFANSERFSNASSYIPEDADIFDGTLSSARNFDTDGQLKPKGRRGSDEF